MDVKIEAGKSYTQIIPKGWNSLIFVYEGEGKFGAEQNTVLKEQV